MVFAYINKSKSRKEGELNSQLFALLVRVSERMTTIQVLLSIVSGTIVGFVLSLLGGCGQFTNDMEYIIVNPGTRS
ncbi:hypothetical protein ACWGJQ_23960 [Peribacillus simplex]